MYNIGTCNLKNNRIQPFFCEDSSRPYPNRAQAIIGCRIGGVYCTILLEEKGYEFPKDYPLNL